MNIRMIGGLFLAAAIPLCFSCNKDEEPKPATIGFAEAEMEVTESDGTLKSFHPLLGIDNSTGTEYNIKLLLDKAVSETSVISYTVSGTASKASSSSSSLGDFDIESDNITIEKGATEALIKITVFEDGEYEIDEFNADKVPFENIVITLNAVVSGTITIGEQTTFTMTITEDDTLIFLDWDPQDQDGDDGGDVDMDLFAWLDGDLFDWSITRDNKPEYIFIYGGYPSGTYSFSHTYYDGNSNDLEFYSVMFGNLNGTNYPYPENPLVKVGNYTLGNKNTYNTDVEVPDVRIIQSLVKNGLNFTNVSEIVPVDGGSRLGVTGAISKLKRLNILADQKFRNSTLRYRKN